MDNKCIIDKVDSFIRQEKLVSQNDSLLLAISGGKDSCVLLDIMFNLSESYNLRLGVFHLNHNLRGAESDGDASFVSAMALRYNLPYYEESYNFLNTTPDGVSLEDFARKIRYSFLEKCADENGYTKIATAHTCNDQAETIFYRIITGTGLAGLSGIPARRGNIIRPMLLLTSSEVYEYLKQGNLDWREDSSNVESIYRRNFLRNRVFPLIDEAFPAPVHKIAELGELAKDSADLMDQYIAQKYIRNVSVDEIDVEYTSEVVANRKLLNYLMAEAIRKTGGYVSQSLLDEIWRRLLDAAEKSHAIVYSVTGLSIYKTEMNMSQILRIRKVPFAEIDDWSVDVRLTGNHPAELVIGDNINLWYDIISADKLNDPVYKNALFVSFNGNARITMRSRQTGDLIVTGKGERTLKKLYIDHKIPIWLKKSVPVITIDNEIAAVGFGLVNIGRNVVNPTYLVNDKKILAIYTVEKY